MCIPIGQIHYGAMRCAYCALRGLTVHLEAYAEHAADPGQVVKVTEAAVTFVAVDDQRRSRLVPPQGSTP